MSWTNSSLGDGVCRIVLGHTAAIVAAIALGCVICFQLLLAAGLPLGRAAWGGQHAVLPALNVTKGNVSVAIRQLEHLQMVRRSQQRGDRRVFFEAEGDFLKLARSVLSRRHKPEFEESFALVERSAALAADAEPSSERTLTLERLQALQEFYGLLDAAVENLLAMNPEQLRQALQLMGQFAKG